MAPLANVLFDYVILKQAPGIVQICITIVAIFILYPVCLYLSIKSQPRSQTNGQSGDGSQLGDGSLNDED